MRRKTKKGLKRAVKKYRRDVKKGIKNSEKSYGETGWEEHIHQKEGITLEEMKETNVIRSSSDSMIKGMKAERKERKQETRKKRLGRALKKGFSWFLNSILL